MSSKQQPYKTNRHSCYDLEYHLVVVTKYRHKIITGTIKDRLISLSHELFESKWQCTITAINTGEDHIHIIFGAPPQVQLSKLINNYKTVSSRLIRKEFSSILEPYYWKPYFWSDSYFVCTVSDRSHDMIEKYIQEQGR